MKHRRLGPAVLACFVAAGLIGAHVVAYLIAVPDAAVRATILRASGHGYLPAASVVAVVAAIFGSFAAAAIGFRKHQPGVITWPQATARIALVQTAAFATLEIAERAAAGVSPGLIGPRLAVIGVAVQVVVAVVAAAVVFAIYRTAAVVRRALAGKPMLVRRRFHSHSRLFAVPLPKLAIAGRFDSRGPPSPPR